MSALEEKKKEYRRKMVEEKDPKKAAEYKRLFRNLRNQIEMGRRK